MHPSRVPALRTRLRDVNVEHSALLKKKTGVGRFVRMAELRNERATLMALLAREGVADAGGLLRVMPGQQPLADPDSSTRQSNGSAPVSAPGDLSLKISFIHMV